MKRRGRDYPADICGDCGVNLYYGPHRLGCEVGAAEAQDAEAELAERLMGEDR